MFRFPRHAAKLVHLVAHAQRLGTNQHANPAVRKILNEFSDDWQRRIGLVADAK